MNWLKFSGVHFTTQLRRDCMEGHRWVQEEGEGNR